MVSKRFTEADYAEMAALREAGQSQRVIAKLFGCSFGLVYWTCLRLGADAPDSHKLVTRDNPPLARRGTHIVRGYTAEEDAIILDLEARGETSGAMGRRLGRTRNSIMARLLTLARRDARAEQRERVLA